MFSLLFPYIQLYTSLHPSLCIYHLFSTYFLSSLLLLSSPPPTLYNHHLPSIITCLLSSLFHLSSIITYLLSSPFHLPSIIPYLLSSLLLLSSHPPTFYHLFSTYLLSSLCIYHLLHLPSYSFQCLSASAIPHTYLSASPLPLSIRLFTHPPLKTHSQLINGDSLARRIFPLQDSNII